MHHSWTHSKRRKSFAVDRIIATRMGAKAIELLLDGKTNLMIGVEGESIITRCIEEGIKKDAIPDLSKLKLLEELRTKQ